jgi:hypothetical protein
VRADLSHEAVLVAVHARQLPHVRERVLQTVRLRTTNDTVPIRQGRGTRLVLDGAWMMQRGRTPHHTNTTMQTHQLEGVDVAEAVLHVRVDDELGQAQDLARQVERVAKARLLALLSRRGKTGG